MIENPPLIQIKKSIKTQRAQEPKVNNNNSNNNKKSTKTIATITSKTIT